MSYTLLKIGKGAVWHYRFQVNGTRVQRSTRERVKYKAQEVAERAYAEAVAQANGGRIAPTLAEQFVRWLAVHRLTASAAHFRSVETVGRLHLYDLGARPINTITTEDIERMRNEHLMTHSQASTNHWLAILKLIAMWTVKRGEIQKVPWNVKMLKVQKRPRPTLPVDVAKAWFDELDKTCHRNPSVATAVRLMFGAGLRESEAATARWEWVDWQRSMYTPGITKGREAEPVPLPEWLIQHLVPLRKTEGLICSKRNGERLQPQFSRSAIARANRACKLMGITPHRLRGTFATLLSEAGVPIQTIQKVMRHKHPMTTMAYLERNLATAASAQDRIGQIIGFMRRESGEAQQSKPTDV